MCQAGTPQPSSLAFTILKRITRPGFLSLKTHLREEELALGSKSMPDTQV